MSIIEAIWKPNEAEKATNGVTAVDEEAEVPETKGYAAEPEAKKE